MSIYKTTTNQDFLYFQKKFNEYAKKLGVGHYIIYFEHTDIPSDSMTPNGAYACIYKDATNSVATVQFCKIWETVSRPLNKREIEETAKHEAIHLLLAKLSDLAYRRYVTALEIFSAEEELVRKIQKII